MKTNFKIRVNRPTTRRYEANCSNCKENKNTNNGTPKWVKIAQVFIPLLTVSLPLALEVYKLHKKSKTQKENQQEQIDRENLRHEHKMAEITHKTDECIRKEAEKLKTAAAKVAVQQNAKSSWGTSVTVHQDGSITEATSPIEKYVKAYYESGKNCQPTRIADSPARPQRYLMGHIIRVGNFTMLVGESGSGKSNLMIEVGFAAAEGKTMLALPNLNRENLSPMHVLYFSSEKMADVFKERGYGKQPDLFSLYDNVHFKTPRECLETIYRSAPHDQDCLIELDGLTNMFLGDKSSDDIAIFLGIFRQIQDDLSKQGVYWTLITGHHTTKDGTDKKTLSRSKIKGSSNWDIFADSTNVLLPGEHPNERFLRPMKCRDLPDERHLTYVMRLENTPRLHFEYVRTKGLPLRKAWKKMSRREIEKVLELAQSGMKIPEIANKTGRDYNTIKKVLKQHQ